MNRYINENDKKMDELLQKYIAGNASEKESQRIMEWLREDEQHLREYKRQRKLYDITLWQTKSPVDIQQEKKDPLRRVLDVIVRIAAVIVFTVATTYFYTHHVLQDKEENMQTVVVPAGQHAELYLADGTHVWLNSGSRLTFPGRFSKKVRHVELDGEGYFKVISSNGTEYYTRDGSFKLDSYGRLVTANGNILEVQYANGYSQNNTGLTADNFTINKKGEIFAENNGNFEKVGEIAVYTAVGNDAFTSVGDNLFKELNGVQVYRTLDADMYQGYLEASNVDLSQEMTDMIVTQRAFQLSSKGITAADEMWEMINNLR